MTSLIYICVLERASANIEREREELAVIMQLLSAHSKQRPARFHRSLTGGMLLRLSDNSMDGYSKEAARNV